MKGFEYAFERHTEIISAGQHAEMIIHLHPLKIPQESGAHWLSGDVHVHMNYAGSYRNTPAHLVAQAAAENLSVVEDLIVNKETRVPDIAYFTAQPDPASTTATLLLHSQEFHTSYWGHLGLLNLTGNIILPGYAGYPNTAAASLFPANGNVADLAHAQHALVGYVHPYDTLPDPQKDSSLNHELPVDLALGKVDYMEILGFAEHKSTAEVWYRLLNCGFHLPAAAGTDAMANYASLRGPVGLNRVYVNVPVRQPNSSLKIAPWLDALKKGKTFATNGPLLGFALNGKEIGDTLQLPAGDHQIKITGWLRSIVPIEHLELFCNGQVARAFRLNSASHSADINDTVSISQSGWCLLRAFSDKSAYPILDMYPYATTSPIYIEVAGSHPSHSEDARYFRSLDRSHDRSARIQSRLEQRGGKIGYTGTVVKSPQRFTSIFSKQFLISAANGGLSLRSVNYPDTIALTVSRSPATRFTFVAVEFYYLGPAYLLPNQQPTQCSCPRCSFL